MYVPKKFRAKSVDDIKTFIKENSFASLISYLGDKPIATHTPLFYSQIGGEDYLIGHISKANEQHQCFDGKQKLLAIFQNQHSYISSSWYSHTNAPTWNYISAHITGTVSPMTEQESRNLISNMVDHYEQVEKNPFKVSDFEEKKFAEMLNAIVAFKMKIENFEAAYKLSQNRNDLDHQNIVAELRKKSDPFSKMIADDMEFERNEKKSTKI